ncbi:MAG: hypothetical protein MK116_01260 [Phycisphaerales bacterium]|nr:hypothetical protein [Phycisphaerales bacterium]
MKHLWFMVSSLALIIMIIAAVGIGWLSVTGELDADRVAALREAWFAPLASETEASADEQDAATGARPGSSERRLADRSTAARQVAVSRQTLQQEVVMRQRQIDTALAELARAREDLAREREIFEAARRASEEATPPRDADAQFRRSVQLIESAQPLQAKIWLLTMVDEGRFEDAVATLDAMRERSATRILREFQSGRELELAGKLLEALGRYGTSADSATLEETRQRVSHPGNVLSEP